MVFIMDIKVDGGCRGNGRPGAIGAAAAVFLRKDGQPSKIFISRLPASTRPTNQRAEIYAIIIALEQALIKYNNLTFRPILDVTIMSDSKYAIKCINEWIYKWCANGWKTSAGYEVANRDLIERMSELDDEIRECGDVRYTFIPRTENEIADEACNEAMDTMYD
jgi:ribonuclease HI